MKLNKLMEIQASGAIKVSVNDKTGVVSLGPYAVTNEQCQLIAKDLGWLSYDKKSWEVIDKTNKFIRSLRSNLTNETVINTAEVTFQNRRMTDTMKYFDRIKMVSPYFDITILYGMPGVGGTYAVYDGSNGFRQPVFNCRTMKDLAEYIDELV